MVYFKLIVELLRSSLSRVSDPKMIHKLISYLFQYRLKNRFQAIYEITKVVKNGSFTDKIEYFNAIQMIESEMI